MIYLYSMHKSQVGTAKRKQLYRKGKIVLILKKTIANEENGDYHNHVKKKMMMKRRNQGTPPRNINQFKEEDYSQATTTTTPSTNDNDNSNNSSSASSSNRNNNDNNNNNNGGRSHNLSKFKMLLDSSASASASASTADQTDRTSLGRSTRWPYKSYSEKFLAQQDEEKRQCLLAIMEGRPLLLLDGTDAPAVASTLLLTNGGATEQHHHRVPIDPDADIIPSTSSRSGCNSDDWKSGTTQFENSTCHGGDMATRTTMGESYRSSRGSARRGVYGGGVRYFTPDYSLYSESDDDDDQIVIEECGDADALKEAENKQDDAIETEGSLGSNMDSASVVNDEEEAEVDDVEGEEEKGYKVRAPTPLFAKESTKKEKKKREKKEKKGKLMNRTRCRSNNRRRSPLVASINDDSSSLSSNS